MKYIKYCIIGIAMLIFTAKLIFWFGGVVGVGTNSMGLVVSAVAILNTTLIICTFIVIDFLREKYKN